MPATCNRHVLHLCSYGCVSLALMLLGCIFSGFAIFEKDSEIAKVWLAGPTTIAVGLVLCGKVLIDWGPSQWADDDEESALGDEEASFAGRLPDHTDARLPEYQALRGSIGGAHFVNQSAAVFNESAQCDDATPMAETAFSSPSTTIDVWSRRNDVCAAGSTADTRTALVADDSAAATESYVSLCNAHSLTDDRPKTHIFANPRLVSQSSSSIAVYQGETFVFHERQYLI